MSAAGCCALTPQNHKYIILLHKFSFYWATVFRGTQHIPNIVFTNPKSPQHIKLAKAKSTEQMEVRAPTQDFPSGNLFCPGAQIHSYVPGRLRHWQLQGDGLVRHSLTSIKIDNFVYQPTFLEEVLIYSKSSET